MRVSQTARNTAAIAALQADSLETKAALGSMEAKLDLLLSAMAPTAPAKPVTQPKAVVAAQPKAAPKPKASLCKSNREAFVAKAPWAKGLSTLAIATEVVEGRRKAPAGFQIGEAYTRKVLTGAF